MFVFFLLKSSKEAQTLEKFYEYQNHSKNLKALIKTIEDEIIVVNHH